MAEASKTDDASVRTKRRVHRVDQRLTEVTTVVLGDFTSKETRR